MVNGLVLGVNELADGKAITAIEDISREFEKLRRVAEMLGLSNARSINWTLFNLRFSFHAKMLEQNDQRKETK